MLSKLFRFKLARQGKTILNHGRELEENDNNERELFYTFMYYKFITSNVIFIDTH